ncbi:MAG: ABC transporter substrate-binding protein [Nitrososphaerales archaeon]
MRNATLSITKLEATLIVVVIILALVAGAVSWQVANITPSTTTVYSVKTLSETKTITQTYTTTITESTTVKETSTLTTCPVAVTQTITQSITKTQTTTQTVTVQTTQEPRFVLEIYGNANLDEAIDIKDLYYIQSILKGEVASTTFADANMDGKVDEQDLRHVEAIIKGEASFLFILDGNGKPLKVKMPIKRLGVEYLSNIELVRILGAIDRVIAVDFAPYQLRHFYLQEIADKVVNLGNMFRPDYELVTSLRLDAIFSFSPDVDEKQAKLPDTTVIFLGLYWPDVFNPRESRFIQGVMKAGYILGEPDKAKAYIDWLISLIELIKSRTTGLTDDKKPKVLMTGMVGYFRNPQEKSIRTYTLRDPLSQMCLLTGGKPIAMDLADWQSTSYYTTIDPEWVLEKNPEYIFIHCVRYTYGAATQSPAYGYDVDDKSDLEKIWSDIASRELLAKTKAVSNKRVYLMAGDFRNNAMGSVLGAVYLARILHPTLFGDLNPKYVHQEYVSRWLKLKYDLDEHGTFLFPPIYVEGRVVGVPSN